MEVGSREGELRRPRTYRQKSHRGCTNCKNLRRKCGEEQPACKFCVKEGKTCDYDFDSLLRFQAYTPDTPKPKPEKRVAVKKPIRRKSAPESRNSTKPSLSPPSLPRRATEPESLPQTTPSIPQSQFESLPAVTKEPESLSLIPLTSSIPAAPEDALDTIDVPYVQYWLSEMPKIHPFATVFPEFLTSLFQASASTAPLRHSLVSLSAFVADNTNHKSLSRAMLHHQETIRKIQKNLSPGTITEATIYAVMMLAYFNVFTGKFLSARRHIRGLSLLLHNYSKEGKQASSTTMLIWRCAIRIDYFLASVYPCKPIFPTPPLEQEDLHRRWIRRSVRIADNGEEWALAQFALDNLQSRAAHLSWQASQWRKMGDEMEDEIQGLCTSLIQDFTTWRQRSVFLEEDAKLELEELLQGGDGCGLQGNRFLGFPSMRGGNGFYASLLNEYRCAVLFITFIASPLIGQPSPFDEIRKFHAIDSCRSIASSGETLFPVPMVRMLQLAGLVFAKECEYPAECEWILKQLDHVSKRGIMGAQRVKEMLQVVWKSTYPPTYEETERVMQNEDDLEQLGLEEVYHTKM